MYLIKYASCQFGNGIINYEAKRAHVHVVNLVTIIEFPPSFEESFEYFALMVETPILDAWHLPTTATVQYLNRVNRI